jgi:hypothetical protein
MTQNLRSPSTTKTIIYDYIDAIKTKNSAAGEDVRLELNFSSKFRQELQSYNPDLNEEIASKTPRYSDKDLQCFIHAANTKHEIYSNDNYYIYNLTGIALGFIAGAVITFAALVEYHKAPQNCKHIIAGGGLVGGFVGLIVKHIELEQKEFWQEALECYDGISSSELPGALMDVE